MKIVFVAAVVIASLTWTHLWKTGRLNWRLNPIHLRFHGHESGETSISVLIIALALIGSITLLTVMKQEVPEVLQQGLSGVLIGVGTSEVSIRRSEKRSKQS